MAVYEYACDNEKCKEFDKIKECSIGIKEYSEEKLPKCEECGKPTKRKYNANFGAQNFDGTYRG